MANASTNSSPTQNAIIWPSRFRPGFVDNWVSNEVIEANLSAADIWPLLATITKWESYYLNCSQIAPPQHGPTLQRGDVFKFATFGLPQLSCSVEECVEPAAGVPGRLAWRGWMDGDGAGENLAAEAYHAWLVEDLDGGRVRILTQESQVGEVVVQMREADPKMMLNGHQDWLLGLVRAARAAKGSGT